MVCRRGSRRACLSSDLVLLLPLCPGLWCCKCKPQCSLFYLGIFKGTRNPKVV